MDDRNKKESTPPPLLLMPAGGGLSLRPHEQPSMLMPVVQSEPSLIDEDCEADSFVGQGPPTDAPGPGEGTLGSMTYFQDPSSGASDPFAQVGHLPPPQPLPPAFSLGSVSSAPFQLGSLPSAGQMSTPMPGAPVSSLAGINPPTNRALPSSEAESANVYRQKGPMRRAQPPPGVYGLNTATSLPQTDQGGPVAFGMPPPPPSGFSTAPFMTPASSGSGPHTQGALHFPGTTGQLTGQSPARMMIPGVGLYQPVRHHWCYRKIVEGQEVWFTFSHLDTSRLEEQFLKEKNGEGAQVVSTDGGRYDVEIGPRLRRSVYWEEEPTTVRRCSWFHKREKDNRFVPYDEVQSDCLETEYKNAIECNDWHKRINLPGSATVVMHNPNVMVHFHASAQPDEWGNVQGDETRPCVVKRGVEDFGTTEDGESEEVDHLVFVVHGIGDSCEVRFRNIVECVDDVRSIANGLIKSHFGPYATSRHVHRVEFLPVCWHAAFHSETTEVDSRLKAVTLPSTRKLRDFVNTTLMDILFFTSPSYCQTICNTVGGEMNRLFQMFLTRNPTFNGEVSVAGHGLGGAVLFDLLIHQQGLGDPVDPDNVPTTSDNISDQGVSQGNKPEAEDPADMVCETEPEPTLEGLLEKVGLKDKVTLFQQEQMDFESLSMCSEQDLKDLGLPLGPRKKLQLLLQEHKGKKEKRMRQEIRQEIRKEFEEKMKQDNQKPENDQLSSQTPSQSNISVQYVCGLGGTGQPYVQYPQLEFSPTCLFSLGSPIAVFLSVRGVQQIGESFKLPTCARFLNVFHPFDPIAYRMEPLISSSCPLKPVLVPHHKGRKRLHLELKESIARMGTDLKQKIIESLRSTWNSLHEFAQAHRRGHVMDDEKGLEREVDQQVDSVMSHMAQQHDDKSDTASVCSSHEEDIPMGQLNEGRRVDFVLQEKPIESFNDYLFALASHSCYWNSEDTVLLILKEIYAPLGISPIMPGPGGRTPRPFMPPAVGPPPKSVSPYAASGTSHPASFVSQDGLSPFPSSGSPSLLPPSGPSSVLPPSSTGGGDPYPHWQGPLTRVASPFVSGGARSEGSSRSSTPPRSGAGGIGMAVPSSQVRSAGPPPAAEFVLQSPSK